MNEYRKWMAPAGIVLIAVGLLAATLLAVDLAEAQDSYRAVCSDRVSPPECTYIASEIVVNSPAELAVFTAFPGVAVGGAVLLYVGTKPEE